MSRGKVTQLGAAIVYFFENYLPAQRGMSQHTIHSYRDAIVMLLTEALNARSIDAPAEKRAAPAAKKGAKRARKP